MYRRVAELLKSWGWDVQFAAGWETRSNSSTVLIPTPVTVHHTGGYATATSYMMNPRDRPQLKVLCNVHITRDHKIKILCAGGASHAGYTYKPNFDTINEGDAPLDRDLKPGGDSSSFSPNKRSIGIEVDGQGGANEWDEWMHGATVAFAAAAQVANGWMYKGGNARVCAHKEHTKRKPGDPFINMGTFRKEVAAFVEAPYGPSGTPVVTEPVAVTPTQIKRNSKGFNVLKLQKLLIAKGAKLSPDSIFGPITEAKVKEFQKSKGLQADGIVGPKTWKALTA